MVVLKIEIYENLFRFLLHSKRAIVGPLETHCERKESVKWSHDFNEVGCRHERYSLE